jgi:hypothetical protein
LWQAFVASKHCLFSLRPFRFIADAEKQIASRFFRKKEMSEAIIFLAGLNAGTQMRGGNHGKRIATKIGDAQSADPPEYVVQRQVFK